MNNEFSEIYGHEVESLLDSRIIAIENYLNDIKKLINEHNYILAKENFLKIAKECKFTNFEGISFVMAYDIKHGRYDEK